MLAKTGRVRLSGVMEGDRVLVSEAVPYWFDVQLPSGEIVMAVAASGFLFRYGNFCYYKRSDALRAWMKDREELARLERAARIRRERARHARNVRRKRRQGGR